MNKSTVELKKKAESLGLEIKYQKWGYGNAWCARCLNDYRLENTEIRFGGWVAFAGTAEKALQVIDKFAEDIKRPDFYTRLFNRK